MAILDIEKLSQNLITLSRTKYEILQQVYLHTKTQNEEIVRKQCNVFLSLYDEKKQLIAKANELDSIFQEQYEMIKDAAGDNFLEVLSRYLDLKELQQIIIQNQQLSDQIILLEARNKEGRKQMLAESNTQIQQTAPNVTSSISAYKKMKEFKKEDYKK